MAKDRRAVPAASSKRTTAQAAENPRSVVGDNQAPDYAREVSARMAKDYAASIKNVENLLAEAKKLPKLVDDDEKMGLFASVIVRMRDAFKTLDAYREAEKSPYLRSGEAVDQFFFGQMERIAKRTKNGVPGVADDLQSLVDAYNQKKLAEERRLRLEQEQLQREELERTETARRAEEQRLRDATDAAARARKPEIVDALEQIATSQAITTDIARADEHVARSNVVDAKAAAAAKPADLVRTRTDGGNLVTMRQVPYVEIVDRMKLDFSLIAPFIGEEDLLKAVKAWARTTQHKKPMAGAIIEMRNETVVR